MRTADRKNQGFTLLELVTSILIIAILFTIGAALFSDMRVRADKIKCMANLRGLYAGTELYCQENGQWPQIETETLESDELYYCQQWIAALKPYGLTQINWICPTHQRMINDPDLHEPKNLRVDYLAMPFDDKLLTPHLWPKQPWFIERFNEHAGGNLIIYTNGQVESLREALRK